MGIRCWFGFHKWYRVDGRIWWFEGTGEYYKSCTRCDHDRYAD